MIIWSSTARAQMSVGNPRGSWNIISGAANTKGMLDLTGGVSAMKKDSLKSHILMCTGFEGARQNWRSDVGQG